MGAGAEDPKLCGCHSIPMRWNKDRRLPAGGVWRCRGKDRAENKARLEAKNAWARDRWHNDQMYRLKRGFAKERLRSRHKLERLREARHSALPQ